MENERYHYNEATGQLIIRDGVTEIGYEEFRDWDNLKHVVFSDSVTKIGERAFQGCK